MKRILTIQDLSCVGRCSLTVALPILSAMGIQCSVLPTAVLSTHTGFPKPHVRSLTEEIEPIYRHFLEVNASFDAILVGYLSDPEQARQVEKVLELFPALTVIDPAMGDHGKLYRGMTEQNVQAMKTLCARGDYLLPNLTEAALLTDMPYRDDPDAEYLQALLQKLMAFGVKGVVITGIAWDENTTGFAGIDRETGEFSYRAARIPRQSHGTGDMFCAVTMGALVKGATLYDAARQAAGFVEQVILATPEPTPFGANFEPVLPWLLRKNEE
jgi:pyridoxine kinase